MCFPSDALGFSRDRARATPAGLCGGSFIVAVHRIKIPQKYEWRLGNGELDD